MGMFGGGGGGSSKTVVKPSKQVDSLLKDITNRAGELDRNYQFTPRELAAMSPEQQGALANLSASPELRQGSQMLSGQTQQGINSLRNAGNLYQQLANSRVDSNDVNNFRSALTGANSLSSRATGQGTRAGGAVSGLGNSAALRSAGRFNTGNINALTQNQRSQQAAGIGANTMLGNLGYGQRVAGLQGDLGNNSLNLGRQGVAMGQQAIQNQLNAGNFQQQYNQQQNNVNWQNAMGQQMSGWDRINNQLNVLNNVSPLAGYTSTDQQPGINKGQVLLGQGIQLAGSLGQMGAFGGGGQQASNAWNSYNANGGQAGVAGPTLSGGNLSNMSQQSPLSTFFSNANQRMGYGSYFGGS